jgi:hypothetical protein
MDLCRRERPSDGMICKSVFEKFLDLGRVCRQRRYPSDLTDEQWALVEPPSSGRELLLMSAPERVPGRSSHWSMLNMPSGTPAISIWRQIVRHCGSSW